MKSDESCDYRFFYYLSVLCFDFIRADGSLRKVRPRQFDKNGNFVENIAFSALSPFYVRVFLY